MNIKSETNFTEKTFKDVAMFRFSLGKTGIAAAVFAVYALALIAGIISVINLKDVFSAVVCVLLVVIGLWLYYLLSFQPRAVYKAEALSNHLKYEYTFCDSDFIIKTKNDFYTSLESMRYDGLLRVNETEMYFLLFVTSRRFYVVEKSGMSVENVAQLRERFLSETDPKKVFVKNTDK